MSDQHRFIVTVDGCTHDQAHQVMSERLGFDEDYGFAYGLDWDEAPAVVSNATPAFDANVVKEATDVALAFDSVKTASFSLRTPDRVAGVAFDASVQIEFDVVLERHGVWRVNDDQARDFYHPSLARALDTAIRTNVTSA